jgi:peptide/nickel transport system substrate-binding protein
LIVTALIGVLLTVSVNRARQEAAPPPKNQIVYGLAVQPAGLDPHVNSGAEVEIILRSVYDTLVYRDPITRGYQPGLATQTDVTTDGLTYTFKLRRDVLFHDGTPFNALSVARTLDRIINPETKAAQGLRLLGSFDKYVVLDQFTIQITLKRPDATFLDSLTQTGLGIASPTALQTYDAQRYQFHQVGSGPYQFVEYIPGSHVTLRRNPAYAWGGTIYRPVTLADGLTPVDEIVFRFYEESTTRAPALQSGAVTMIGNLSPIDARALAGNGEIRLYPQPIPGTPTQWLFNTVNPPTDSLEVRQALLYGSNRPAVVGAVYQEFSPVAHSPLSASTPYYDPTLATLYPYDLAKSSTLFAAKNWALNSSEKLLKNNRNEAFRLVMVVPRWGQYPEVAERLIQQWVALGITVETRFVPTLSALLAEQARGEYHLIAYEVSAVDAGFLTKLYRSDAAPNWTKFKNGQLDSWLTEADRTLDAPKRAELYARIQRRLMEQALVFPIRDVVNLNAANIRLGSVSFSANGFSPNLYALTWRERVP